MLTVLRKNDRDYPYVSNFALLALCGYVLIWYLQMGYRIPFLGKIRIEFISAAFLSVYAIFSIGKIELNCPVIKGVLLLYLAIVIQLPFAHDSFRSWNVFVDRIVKFSFMAFFIICFVKSPKQLVFFLGAFLLACTKMSQEGLVGQLTGNLVWQNQGVMRLHGSTPIYAHPNSFSGMALGTMPFAIYLFPICTKYYKAILLVQIGLALNILLHTGSRTGYVGFIAMLMLLFVNSKKKLKFAVVILLVVFFSIPHIDRQYFERFKSIYKGHEAEGASIDRRKEILSDAIEIFAAHPFGVGVASFRIVRWKTFGRHQDTHNLFLEVLTNLGIQGLLVFFSLFI